MHFALNKELIISVASSDVDIALLENGKLVELHRQKNNSDFSVGDIFIGRVTKLLPGLNAAYIDIGHKREAFLHYTDLGPKLRSLLKYTDQLSNGSVSNEYLDKFELEPEIIKTGKINQVLRKNQNILVQILKEPISTKGPRLSCEITLAGRFMVLTPFIDVIAISKKISVKEERKRLQTLVESIKPKNFGLIIRTAAEGRKVAELHEDLRDLIRKWKVIFETGRKKGGPIKLLSEIDKTSSILRDVLNDTFTKIVVNDRDYQRHIEQFMEKIAPEKTKIIHYFRGSKPIFDAYGVTRQIKGSFGKTSTMTSGAYVVIDHTEAMHVIDVNSGPKFIKGDQETSALKVNLEACEEIARQLRLRDIGGLIIVDFIDMKNKDNKHAVFAAIKEQMKADRAQHTILPLSKFGLMQITRQRVKPELQINTEESCPTCKGTGTIQPAILLIEELERDIGYIIQSRPSVKLYLYVHPYVEAFLIKGLRRTQRQWFFKYKQWIKIKADQDLSMLAYRFFDNNEDEIRLN